MNHIVWDCLLCSVSQNIICCKQRTCWQALFSNLYCKKLSTSMQKIMDIVDLRLSLYLTRKDQELTQIQSLKSLNKPMDQDVLNRFIVIPSLILKMAPSFRDWVSYKTTSWQELEAVTPHILQHLGISRHAWGQACFLVFGKQKAISIIAVIEARHSMGLVRKPGRDYFVLLWIYINDKSCISIKPYSVCSILSLPSLSEIINAIQNKPIQFCLKRIDLFPVTQISEGIEKYFVRRRQFTMQ